MGFRAPFTASMAKSVKNARANASKLAAAEEIQNNVIRLQTLKAISEEEQEIERQRLQNQIDLLGEGTQARQDAEQQLQDFLLEKKLEQRDLDNQIEEETRNNKLKT